MRTYNQALDVAVGFRRLEPALAESQTRESRGLLADPGGRSEQTDVRQRMRREASREPAELQSRGEIEVVGIQVAS